MSSSSIITHPSFKNTPFQLFYMDELLLILLQKGAHLNPVRITTAELGNLLGMSQQNASYRLARLEKSGQIEKRKGKLILTNSTIAALKSLHLQLKDAFEPKPISVCGRIESGLGEGKYYLSFSEYTKQIEEKLGFLPYPGTLNIKLDEESAAKKSLFVKSSEPILILGFEKDGRTFGDLFLYKCRTNQIECALLIPSRTHHPVEIIEIISASNLKEKLGKKDGDELEILF